VECTFSTREDGQVDAMIVGEHPLLNEALADSISSLPPRGAPGLGPSTYWIDVARAGTIAALESDSDAPFTGGNVTVLRIRDGMVEARFDFDDEALPGDTITVSDFIALLDEWRSRDEDSARVATSPLPKTYRRNPMRPQS
jgi:hypothetical protein